jgi:hypothetical protein
MWPGLTGPASCSPTVARAIQGRPRRRETIHRPAAHTSDRRPITDDQLIHALELGDVVILYDAQQPPPALVQLQADVMGGPFDAEVAAAGQAVILARRPGAGPATALAWRRILRADDPADPALLEFTEFWLGRGLQP